MAGVGVAAGDGIWVPVGLGSPGDIGAAIIVEPGLGDDVALGVGKADGATGWAGDGIGVPADGVSNEAVGVDSGLGKAFDAGDALACASGAASVGGIALSLIAADSAPLAPEAVACGSSASG